MSGIPNPRQLGHELGIVGEDFRDRGFDAFRFGQFSLFLAHFCNSALGDPIDFAKSDAPQGSGPDYRYVNPIRPVLKQVKDALLAGAVNP